MPILCIYCKYAGNSFNTQYSTNNNKQVRGIKYAYNKFGGYIDQQIGLMRFGIITEFYICRWWIMFFPPNKTDTRKKHYLVAVRYCEHVY